MGRVKEFLLRELREPVPPDEKGFFEPLDKINRWTMNKSRDAGVTLASAAAIFPITAPLTVPGAIIASAWTLGDRIQDQLSQTLGRELHRNSEQKTLRSAMPHENTFSIWKKPKEIFNSVKQGVRGSSMRTQYAS